MAKLGTQDQTARRKPGRSGVRSDPRNGTSAAGDRGGLRDGQPSLARTDLAAENPVLGALRGLQTGLGNAFVEHPTEDPASAFLQQHTLGCVALAVAGFEGAAQLTPGQAPPSVMRSLMRNANAADEGLDTRRAAQRIDRRAGQPLPEAVRTRMERAFGHDFSHVRIHTDAGAADAASALHAMAFAVGRDLYFGRGAWRPGTPRGDELLAHELTHVVQADEGRLPGASGTGMDVSSPTDSHEREADSTGRSMAKLLGSGGAELGSAAAEADGLARQDSGPHTREAPDGGAAAAAGAAAGAQTDEDLESEAGLGADAQGLGGLDSAAGGQDQAPPPDQALDEATLEAQETAMGGEARSAAPEAAGRSQETAAQASGDEDAQSIEQAADEEASAAGMDGEEEAEEAHTPQEQGAEEQAADAADDGDASAQPEPGRGDSGEGEAVPPPSAPQPAPVGTGAGPVAFGVPNGPVFPAARLAETGVDLASLSNDDKDQLAALVAQDRATDESLAAAFLGGASARGGQLAGLSETIVSRIRAAAAQARAGVAAEVAQQQSAVQAAAAQAAPNARARADAARAGVAGRLATALSTLDSETEAARSTLLGTRDAALAEVEGLLAAQAARIETLYADADAAYRAAGVTVGEEAVEAAQARAAEFRSHRINRSDSWLKGPLTDNRCEARADAALEVGKSYQAGLVEEANKQADQAQLNKQRDLAACEATAQAARQQVEGLFADLSAALDTSVQSSRAGAQEAAAASRGAIDGSLNRSLGQLSRHESSQIAGLGQAGAESSRALGQQAQVAIATLQETLNGSLEELAAALDAVREDLGSRGPPDPAALAEGLDAASSSFADMASQLEESILQGISDAEAGLRGAGAQACGALGRAGAEATETARALETAAGSELEALQEGANQALRGVEEGHRGSLSTAVQQGSAGFQELSAGVQTAYDGLASQFEAGKAGNVEGLTAGLRGALTDMHGLIDSEADKAAAKVKPRWKSVLKWVLIIAVVIVVAVVLAPMVVGAVAGAAAALGASAATASVVGAVAGGAIVGSVASGSTTVIANVMDGNPWQQGVGQSMAIGAVTGAIGGGVGVATTQLSTGAQVAIGVGADVTVDTAINVSMGTFSWDSLGVTLLSSLVGNSLAASPGIKGFQQGLQSRSAGGANRAFGGSGQVPGVTDLAAAPGRTSEGAAVDATPTVDTTPTVDATPTVDTTPTVDATPAVDTTPTQAAETGTGTPASKPTGSAQARASGFPDAPEGYTWVRNSRGDAPFLRRLPGRGPDGYPPLRYDNGSGVFVDTDTGLSFSTAAEVQTHVDVKRQARGSRPEPESYLSQDQIDVHLAQFDEGAAYLVPKSALDRFGRNPVGRPDGQFVMTRSELDALLSRTGGDISKIETEMGIPSGMWDGQILVRIDIKDPRALGLRMPSGNESGANDLWLPGGKLPTGQNEAVLDPIPGGAFTETVVAGGS